MVFSKPIPLSALEYVDRQGRSIQDRLEEFSTPEPNSGCTIWLGHAKGGYGTTFLYPLSKSVLVHRLAYTLFKGMIPHGLVVMHKCDNRLCINPEHLDVGTNTENIADMDRKGRRIVPNRKLSVAQVNEIRERYRPNSSTLGISALARQYQISTSDMFRVVHGENWPGANPARKWKRVYTSKDIKTGQETIYSSIDEIAKANGVSKGHLYAA